MTPTLRTEFFVPGIPKPGGSKRAFVLRGKARRLAANGGLGLIVVDYLQLLTCPGSDRESRQVEVSAISRMLKGLGRELGAPVLAVAQLNRMSEMRSDNRPRMSDLRESGSIEQDADVVLLLHREAAHHIGDEAWAARNPHAENEAELIVAKQRNGPTGSVKLLWDRTRGRFNSVAHAPQRAEPWERQ